MPVPTSCSNTRLKCVAKWYNYLISELVKQIILYRRQNDLLSGNYVSQLWRVFQHSISHLIHWHIHKAYFLLLLHQNCRFFMTDTHHTVTIFLIYIFLFYFWLVNIILYCSAGCIFYFQDDIVMGTLTVRENLMFSANLRLPDSLSRKEKRHRVEETIQELGLTSCANTKVIVYRWKMLDS